MTRETAPADPGLINRELSWLAFDERVLHEATRPDVPLLERLKFLGITASNLDEFFMVRVAQLKHHVRERQASLSPDGMSAKDQLEAIAKAAHELVDRQYALLAERILPELAAAGPRIATIATLGDEERARAEEVFRSQVLPALTPLVVDASHPFPWISNLSLNVAALVSRTPGGRKLAMVQVPRGISRLVVVGGREPSSVMVLLEDLMIHCLADLFPGGKIQEWVVFRLTRDAELEVDPEGVHDFRKAMESEIRRRRRSDAVRLEATAGRGDAIVERIARKVGLGPLEIYRLPGPIDLRAIAGLATTAGLDAQRYPAFTPDPAIGLMEGSFWDTVAAGDALLSHPYDSFEPVERMVREAADDPAVLAIKMTLYRPGAESAIVDSLVRAAERDKQVTVIVELLARFDEEKNIEWSHRLERAGAHVIYGVAGLKTHAKIALVVRREPSGIRRYVHLGTGNYNARTARLYTDLSLFTADEDFGVDASSFFNVLTGYSDPPQMRRFLMAPLAIRSRFLELVAREADHARRGVPAEIAIKVNSLSDPGAIAALYEASRAGVEVRLVVRGICCLRPGVPGGSDRIQVISIVDRYLEHSRIYYFRNAGHEEVYLASADLMPRNLDRRVELMFPVLAAPLKDRLRNMLRQYLKDNTRAWQLQSDGTYRPRTPAPSEPPFRVQEHFMEEASASATAPIASFRPRARTSS